MLRPRSRGCEWPERKKQIPPLPPGRGRGSLRRGRVPASVAPAVSSRASPAWEGPGRGLQGMGPEVVRCRPPPRLPHALPVQARPGRSGFRETRTVGLRPAPRQVRTQRSSPGIRVRAAPCMGTSADTCSLGPPRPSLERLPSLRLRRGPACELRVCRSMDDVTGREDTRAGRPAGLVSALSARGDGPLATRPK